MALEGNDTTDEATGPDLLSDCRLMLKFATREARVIPVELSADIARLDAILKRLGLPTVSSVPRELISDTDKAGGEGSTVSATELILKIHAALSQIVAPATAMSLQVSEPPPGKHRFLGGMPLLVKGAAWVSIACALGFVMSSIPAAKDKFEKIVAGTTATPTPTPTPTPEVMR